MLRQAAKHSARPADAEDVLQDACIQFLDHYEGPPGVDALRWMMLVTKRRAWAIGSRHRKHEALPELSSTDAAGSSVLIAVADADLDPALVAEQTERREQRFAALAQLKRDERTALALFGLGLSYREIAARKDWTYTKVNRCIAEGRVALRQAPASRPASPNR